MKRSIVRICVRSSVLVALLLASACASRQVRCDRHLVPINIAHGQSTSRAHK